MALNQFLITPSAGKRLIGKALAKHPMICNVLAKGTLVIVAGTTNGYVAEEILKSVGQASHFSRKGFYRGIVLPPNQPTTPNGRRIDESGFKGDVVLVDGELQKNKTIFDVADDLKEGDVIIKGANSLDLKRKKAAVLIGHPKAGTMGAALKAVVGRRVQLILPVGLEKRLDSDLDVLARLVNSPGAKGPRLFPVSVGMVYTEIDAISFLTNASCELIAAGGVGGAEGSLWLAVHGNKEEVELAKEIINSVKAEPPFEL